MYITVIYIIYERSISFLTILKLFKISGLQTKMAFKQSFKYLKNEKINFIIFCSIICIISSYYFIRRAILTQTNPKKGLMEKKHTI